MNKKTLKKTREYLTLLILATISAINFLIFIVNNEFAPAGIGGIATMIQYKLGFSVGYFSLIFNIPLCILAYFFVNKEFAIKSFIFVSVYSVAYILLSKLDLSGIAYKAEGTDTILPVLAAGIINGFIYGEAFKSKGSTGGTDIISKLVAMKKPEFNFVWVGFTLNIIIASASYFVYGKLDPMTGKMVFNMKPVLLCMIYCFISSRTGNALLEGSKRAIKFSIVTDHPEDISKEIMATLHHGVTLTNVTGMYTNTGKSLLTCIINKHQINEFEEIIEKYPNTFAYISTVNKTLGNFKKIK